MEFLKKGHSKEFVERSPHVAAVAKIEEFVNKATKMK